MMVRFSILLLLLIHVAACSFVSPPTAAQLRRAEVYVKQGDKALSAGNLEAADAAYSMAEELGAYTDALVGKGAVASRQGDILQARTLFFKVLRLAPSHAYALGNLGVLCHKEGKFECARSYYSSALQSDPEAAEFRNNLGILFLSGMGTTVEGLEELNRAYSVLPHSLVRSNINKVREERYER